MDLQVIWFKTYEEVEKALPESHDYVIALLDYHLPDAMDGEIIDLCARFAIPSVVMTGTFSVDLQEIIWSKKVIDYVLKDGGHAIEYLVDLVKRSIKNKEIGILVVDDSVVSRRHLSNLLKTHQFKVYEAENGLIAYDILEQNNDIKLVLTDYNMPECNGYELTKKIRTKYSMDRLAIIGLSGRGGHSMMIKFIKYGANDFLSKPFISELLYCRINQNIKIIEYFESVREASLVDHLTKIHNRRYLHESGELLFNTAKRNGTYMAVALLDLDNFKTINDTMGHDAGDMVLVKVAEILKKNIRKTDVLARYGGEEFCILGNNMDPKEALTLFDHIRERVEQFSFLFENEKIQVTVSIGLCIEKKESLTDMINAADHKLYEAKASGKNRICI
jgi:diguanylate cyclase (GGDEF)-like protein